MSNNYDEIDKSKDENNCVPTMITEWDEVTRRRWRKLKPNSVECIANNAEPGYTDR